MKPFKTIEEQIEILRERELNIEPDDVENVKNLLLKYGYYNIINGYKDLFLIEDTDSFRENIYFHDIYNLFSFDKSLRYLTLSATAEIEMTLRTAMSFVIAKKFGVFESDYLDPTNYDSGDYNPNTRQTDLEFILRKLTNATYRDSEPYKHYRDTQGHIPPWILLNALSFGNLHKFYKLQEPCVKDEILDIILKDNPNKDKTLFNDLVYIIYKFRNQAAHIGRLYNYNLKNLQRGSSVTYNESFHLNIGINPALYRQDYGKNDYFTFINSVKFIDEKYFEIVLRPGLYLIFLNFCKNKNLPIEKLISEMGFPSIGHFNDLIKK